MRLALVALQLACSGGDPDAPECNTTYDSRSRTVTADYTPYRWCSSIAVEAARLEESWTCTLTEGAAEAGLQLTMEASAAELDAPQILAIEPPGDCIEVATWRHTVHLDAPELSGTFRGTTQLFAARSGDRSFLAADEIRRSELEGSLFPALADTGGTPDTGGEDGSTEQTRTFVSVEALSRDPIGADRGSWRLQLRSGPDEDYVFDCR